MFPLVSGKAVNVKAKSNPTASGAFDIAEYRKLAAFTGATPEPLALDEYMKSVKS
jgi:hypothetical protein